MKTLSLLENPLNHGLPAGAQCSTCEDGRKLKADPYRKILCVRHQKTTNHTSVCVGWRI